MVKAQFSWFSSKLRRDRIDAFSAQVSYFIIISFIPFMLFVLTLLQSVNVNGDNLLNAALRILPASVAGFLGDIFSEKREGFTLLSIAAVTCIWSASAAMLALIKGLGAVFGSKSRNYFWLRFLSVVFTAAFAVVLAFTCVLLIFGNTIYNNILGLMDARFVKIFVDFKSVIGFVILTVFFTFSYKVLPLRNTTKIRWCFIGGCLTSGAWVLYSFLFSVFVENFANYSNVYGSLAALVILMLWLYFCMYIMFVGGEVAVWLEKGSIREDLRIYRKTRKERKMKQKADQNRNNK